MNNIFLIFNLISYKITYYIEELVKMNMTLIRMHGHSHGYSYYIYIHI